MSNFQRRVQHVKNSSKAIDDEIYKSKNEIDQLKKEIRSLVIKKNAKNAS